MGFFEKGAVRIHYEEAGSGFPLLLIAGGGLNSNISGITGDYPPFNAIKEFGNEYRCIAFDLRNAPPGQSSGPLEIDRPWDSHTDDQLALMDHLGFEKFMVLGFCIGGPLIWNLLKRAPDRVVAGVLAMPSGLAPRNARPVLRQQHEGLGAGTDETPARHHDGDGREIPDEDVSHQSGFRLHGDARFRAPMPDAGADPARRHPGAPLRGRDGERDAGAERGSQPVSVEGAEGARAARGAPDPIFPARAPAGGNS